MIDVEQLAKLLHEAGREAVLSNKVVKKDGAPLGQIKFLEWEEITEDAKEGRRIQAKYLLSKLVLYLRVPRAPKAPKSEVLKELVM